MKKSILLLILVISSFGIIKGQESVAKDECWIDYELIVDSKDASSVVKILNSYFSKPENRIEGVTYNLTEFNFKDKDFEATHLFQLVGPAKAYGELMSLLSVPDMLGDALRGVTESPFLILMIMAFVLIVSGMFLESIAQIILLTPLMLPIVVGLDVDPIVFGILMVISCEIGFLTPPVGVNLFVAARITNLGVDRISIAVIPFLFAYILVLVIISAFPDIVTYLPNLVYGKYG